MLAWSFTGCQVDAMDDVGYTALHLCAEKGFLELAELLMSYGARVCFTDVDTDGRSYYGNPPRITMADEPLRIAIRNDHFEMAELLLKHGANPNARYVLLAFRPDSFDRRVIRFGVYAPLSLHRSLLVPRQEERVMSRQNNAQNHPKRHQQQEETMRCRDRRIVLYRKPRFPLHRLRFFFLSFSVNFPSSSLCVREAVFLFRVYLSVEPEFPSEVRFSAPAVSSYGSVCLCPAISANSVPLQEFQQISPSELNESDFSRYFLGSEMNLISPLAISYLELLLRYGGDPNSKDRSGLTPLMKACRHPQGRSPFAFDSLSPRIVLDVIL